MDAPNARTPSTETAQMPTLPGKVAGIVGWDPMVLQCRDCDGTQIEWSFAEQEADDA